MDQSTRGGGVACFIKSLIEYNYKNSFCINPQSIFVHIYLLKSKPILLAISYRPPNKSDFVKHIDDVFTETGVLDKEECYLLGESNTNPHYGKEIFGNKIYRNGLNLTPLTKDFLEVCFSFSLKSLILQPTRVTSKTCTIINHA